MLAHVPISLLYLSQQLWFPPLFASVSLLHLVTIPVFVTLVLENRKILIGF
jgi:hypothetical protein